MPAADALPIPVGAIVALFLAAFPIFWCAILWLIAGMGWRRLANAYPANSDPPDSADRIRFATLALGASVRSANYSGSINAWLAPSGLWLRPILPFRPFHAMVFIPWAHVRSVASERRMLMKLVRVALGGDVPDLVLSGRLAQAVLDRTKAKKR
ncbi:MAG: hypothetical protein EOP60_11115 [Sphingomonadales bacterium]|nr:MAG: hypothetical protein EOP60_11115 [Sphingomonadales bacterium]